METWQPLYAMIWLAFIEIALVLPPLHTPPYTTLLHIVVGFAMMGIAVLNRIAIDLTAAPDRIKRILKATMGLTIMVAALGFIIGLNALVGPVVCLTEILQFLHLMVSIAIITQAASAATAYDMWEEREFEAGAGKTGPE